MMVSTQNKAWNFTIKTCPFNERHLLICRLQPERNRSGRKRLINALFMDDALKI